MYNRKYKVNYKPEKVIIEETAKLRSHLGKMSIKTSN